MLTQMMDESWEVKLLLPSAATAAALHSSNSMGPNETHKKIYNNHHDFHLLGSARRRERTSRKNCTRMYTLVSDAPKLIWSLIVLLLIVKQQCHIPIRVHSAVVEAAAMRATVTRKCLQYRSY